MGSNTVEVVFDGVDNVSSVASGVSGTLLNLSSFTNIARGAWDLFSGAVNLAVDAMEAVIRPTVDYIYQSTLAAARVGEMNAVLGLLGERAGWTEEQIKGNVDAMKELGIRTDVAQGLLAQFARYNLDAGMATDLARVAQDAAVLSMEDSSEALDGLMHGILTQNSLVLKNHGIMVDVQKAYKDYAAELGISVDAMDETQRIQAVMNAVMEEGGKIAGTYAEAMEEPGKVARSLPRYFYEAGLSIGEFFLPAYGEAVFAVKDFAGSIRESLAEGGQLNTFFAGIAPIVEQFVGAIISVAEKALPVVLSIAETIGTYLGSPEVQGAISGIVDGFKRFAETLLSGDLVGALAQIFPPEIVAALVPFVDKFMEFVSAVFALDVEKLRSMIPPELLAGVQSLWEGLQQLVAAFIGTSDEGIKAGDDVMNQWVTTVIPAIGAIFFELGEVLKKAAAWWNLHGTEVIGIVQWMYSTFVSVYSAIYNTIAFVLGLINNSHQVMSAVLTAIWNNLQIVINTVVRVISALLRGDFIGAFDAAKGGVQLLIQSTINLFNSLPENIRGTISRILQSVLSFVGGFQSAGGSLINGLINGVVSSAGRLVQAAVNAVTSAFNAAKNALGIHSPSSVMYEMGLNVTEGLARGITANSSRPVSAMNTIAGGITGARGGSSSSSIGGITINVSGAGDPEAVAREVDKILSRRLRLQGVRV